MRIVEMVDRHGDGILRVFQVGGGPDLQRHLRPSSAVEVVAGPPQDARAGDLVVDLLAPADAGGRTMADLEAVLPLLTEGAGLLVLLTGPLDRIPVGPLVGILTTAGLQVVEASPLEHPLVTGALMVRRGSKLLPFPAYLSERPAAAGLQVDESAVLRLVNEHQVEGIATRAREAVSARAVSELRAEQDRVAGLREELAAAQRRIAVDGARLRALESSRSVGFGLALGQVRRHPAAGLRALPRSLRKPRPAEGSVDSPSAPDQQP